MDENGNPLPVEETGSTVDDATPDVVESQKVSRILEDQIPQNTVHSAEGKTSKSGKDAVRRGTKTQGKAQIKQKLLKLKKNEISAKVTKILEQGSGGELVLHGTSAEVKNQKQDYKTRIKNTEEEYHGERDDEQQVMSLSETGSVEDDCKDEFNEAENASNNADASFMCLSGQRDSDATDETFLAESYQKVPVERRSSTRSQSRKKRRKGKQNKSQNSKPDSTSVGVQISSATGATVTTSDPVIDNSSNVLPLSISPTNSLKSVSFCCHQLSNVRQKPSARVPPSRSTAVDHDLNSRMVSCVLGEKSSSDLGEKTLNDLSIVEDRLDEEKFCDVEDQEMVKVSVEMRSDSSNTFIVDRKSSPVLETSQPFKNDLSQGLSTEVIQEILPKMQPCVTVQGSVSVCPLSPSRKQSTVIGQQGRVKPQSTVNPFSVLDSSTSVKPPHTFNQTLHPTTQTRIRIEPITGAKPKFNQSPRLKPRSLVNPLQVDQSLQTRVRLHPKFDPVSASTDLPKATTNDLSEIRTTTVSDPNPTFRILRRKPGTSTSLTKHSDSSSTETKHSVVTSEQCSNSCYGNCYHSDSSPSVAKTTVCSESSRHDNLATATKRSDVAKKPQNSRLSDRKILDHNPIPESIRSSTPGSSIDSESQAGERGSVVKVGSSTCDRLPSGSRTSLKNMKTIIGHRTNSFTSQFAENAMTFDLVRAQQYLRAGKFYLLFPCYGDDDEGDDDRLILGHWAMVPN